MNYHKLAGWADELAGFVKLVIYDEVHLLPAPIFRLTADLQSRRRLGLTATLVREDGREDDVFSLIANAASYFLGMVLLA